MIFEDRNEIFHAIKSGLENIAKYHEDPKNAGFDEVELNLITSSMQKRSDKAEILFDTNGSVQKLDISKKKRSDHGKSGVLFERNAGQKRTTR